MAVVMTGTPVHPVYFAKQQLINALGAQPAQVQFLGAKLNSTRDLVVVSSAPGSFGWLQQNLANDGNSKWDINRLMLPPDVREISPHYKETQQC